MEDNDGRTDNFNLFPRKAADNNGEVGGHLNGTSNNGNGHKAGGDGRANLLDNRRANGRNGGNDEPESPRTNPPMNLPNMSYRAEPDRLRERQPTTAETGKLNPAALPNSTPASGPTTTGSVVLSGSLGAFSPSSLLSLLNIQKQTGYLYLRSTSFEGYIYVDKGEVFDAGVGRISSGALAVFQLFGWRQGDFRFEVGVPAPERRTIEASLPVLQVRATLWLDSMSRYSPVIPSPNHHITIAAEPRSEVVIEPYQWPVLTKIVSRSLSVAELAAELGQDLMTVTRIAAELVKMGVAAVRPPVD